MAFNFPDSPTPGQTFYDAASGARYTYTNNTWVQVASSPVLKGTTGDAPPSNPDPGQLWWESDTGRMFIYYNDGNSSQWVQISGPMQQSVGVVKISEYEAPANFAQYDFPLPASSYLSLELHLSRLEVNAAATMGLRLSWDGGATFEAGASSYTSLRQWNDSSSVTFVGDYVSASSITVGASMTSGSNALSRFRMWMPQPAAGKRWTGDWRADVYTSVPSYRIVHGQSMEVSHFGPPNYMRLFVGSNMINAGARIQLYGYQ